MAPSKIVNKSYNIQNTNICNDISFFKALLINEGETTRGERESGQTGIGAKRLTGQTGFGAKRPEFLKSKSKFPKIVRCLSNYFYIIVKLVS
jgi:hypothetical protein